MLDIVRRTVAKLIAPEPALDRLWSKVLVPALLGSTAALAYLNDRRVTKLVEVVHVNANNPGDARGDVAALKLRVEKLERKPLKEAESIERERVRRREMAWVSDFVNVAANRAQFSQSGAELAAFAADFADAFAAEREKRFPDPKAAPAPAVTSEQAPATA